MDLFNVMIWTFNSLFMFWLLYTKRIHKDEKNWIKLSVCTVVLGIIIVSDEIFSTALFN